MPIDPVQSANGVAGLAGGTGKSPNEPQADPFQTNQQWIKPGQHNYNTYLLPEQEHAFRQWIKQNKVEFNPEAGVTDYDMRGFYLAHLQGDPRAQIAVNSSDGRIHYDDFWKTPHDRTFSAESQWADPKTAPRWINDYQLALPNGKVIFDERQEVKAGRPLG